MRYPPVPVPATRRDCCQYLRFKERSNKIFFQLRSSSGVFMFELDFATKVRTIGQYPTYNRLESLFRRDIELFQHRS